MINRKRFLVILICVIVFIGIIATVYFIQQTNPKNVIEYNLNIKIPSSARILNYTKNGGYFDTKILIEENSVKELEEQFDITFGGTSQMELSQFASISSWWDLDKNNIIVYYSSFFDRKKRWFVSTNESHEVWAFITKEKNGQYYLYISY